LPGGVQGFLHKKSDLNPVIYFSMDFCSKKISGKKYSQTEERRDKTDANHFAYKTACKAVLQKHRLCRGAVLLPG